VPEPTSRPRPSTARAVGSAPHALRPTGYLLAAGAATSWGAQVIVVKLLLTSGLPATSLVSTRTALAAITLTATIALVRPGLLRVSPGNLWRLALLGIAGMSLSNYTYYLTLSRIPVAMAAILLYMTPLFVLAGGVLFFRERLHGRDVLAAAVTIIGAALFVRVWEPAGLRANTLGIVLGIFNAISLRLPQPVGQDATRKPVAVDGPRLRVRRRRALLAPHRATLVAPPRFPPGLGVARSRDRDSCSGPSSPMPATSPRSRESARPT
jgi:threonine/homoserine efflux transporter RhtA